MTEMYAEVFGSGKAGQDTNLFAVEDGRYFIDRYQSAALTTAVFDEKRAFEYLPMGLIGEVGEVAEHIKKMIRDDGNELTEARRSALIKELGDVAWYMVVSADLVADRLMSDIIADRVVEHEYYHSKRHLLRHVANLSEAASSFATTATLCASIFLNNDADQHDLPGLMLKFPDPDEGVLRSVTASSKDGEFIVVYDKEAAVDGMRVRLAASLAYVAKSWMIVARLLDLSPVSILNQNIQKLARRAEEGKLKGSGSDR